MSEECVCQQNCLSHITYYIYINASIHLPFLLKSNLFDNGMAAYIVIYITGMFHIASKKLQLINHSEHVRHGGNLQNNKKIINSK